MDGMALSWSSRRKLIYSGVVFFVAFLVILFIWIEFFTATPTCFDNRQNGDELGVDCGGSCSLVCSEQVKDATVTWARAFQTSPHSYTAAAYIQNNSGETAARNVQYAFQLYDADNKLIIEKNGTTDIPPVQTVPIIETMINTGDHTVARTLFSFTSTPVWNHVVHGSVPTARIISQSLTPDAKRLQAIIENNTLDDYLKVTVAAVLFDSEGVARAASKSTIPLVAHKSTQNVVFTWPQGVSDVVRAEISVLPSF